MEVIRIIKKYGMVDFRTMEGLIGFNGRKKRI